MLMATLSSPETAPNTPLLNIHSSRLAASVSQKLPTGRCNFTNLSVGGAAPPRCGCQRFWAQPECGNTLSDRSSGAVTHELSAMCACQHHACFHESESAQNVPEHQVVTSKRMRSSSQYSRDVSQTTQSRPADKRLRQTLAPGDAYEDLRGRMNVSQANLLTDSDLPDTGGWSGLAQPKGLPPIPSQCLLPSDLCSGSIVGHSQSFQSYPTVEITAAAHQDRVMQDHYGAYGQQPPGEALVESFIQSVTDVISPSPSSPEQNDMIDKHIAGIQATVDVLALDVSHRRVEDGNSDNIAAISIRPTENNSEGKSDEHSSAPIHRLVPHLQNILKHVTSHPTLSTKVSNHEQRLDILENAYDSHVEAQEVDEKFELVDERIGEVEIRVEELEKTTAALNDVSGSEGRHRRHLDEGDSETSSAMISSVLDRAELSNRIESLELQFMDLQSSTLPSYARPLQIEVIFLPFGTDLKGIWSTIDKFPSQRSRHNSVAADDRQTQQSAMTRSQAALNGLQDEWNVWKDLQDGQDDWLVARACAQGSKVEERLRSRGLVKAINIKGPDARDVQAAMLSAFRDVLNTLVGVGTDVQLSSTLQGYHGLNASWIPLRKLHKDSRLRFLDPSEMVTSALWAVTFLSSSVAMRAPGTKRLYVTQRESYLQKLGACASWTWQDLRVLPRVFPDEQSNAEVGEADALEACWEWDERLDPPLSLHTSFASQYSQHSTLSIRAAPSRRSISSGSSRSGSARTPVPSTTPTSIAPLRAISPLMERISPLRTRTASMPSMPPLRTPPLQAKRRIASFDFEHSPPRQTPSSPLIAQKRRRISRSPSRPRDGQRWSIGPPSPFEDANHVSVDKRGTTPFAYATPFSNAPPYQEVRHEIMDDQDELGSTTDDVGIGEHDYDSEIDQEFGQGQKIEDEVWEGVEDGMDEDANDDKESDQEGKALSIDGGDDAASDASSGPSEYPSTQPSAMYAGNKGVFHIHVDEEHDTR